MSTAGKPLTEKELAEVQIYQDPVRFAQVMLDVNPRSYQRPVLRDTSSRIILRAGRQIGKCVSGRSKIVFADTGERVLVKDLFKMDPSKRGPILTLNQDNEVVSTSLYDIESNGVKNVYRVTVESGRSVVITINHPLLSPNGWKTIEELAIGDKIGVPLEIAAFGDKVIRDNEVKLLAYLQSRTLKESASENVKIAKDIAVATSMELNLPASCDYRLDFDYGGLPGVIFELNRDQVSLFLNRLFATTSKISMFHKKAPLIVASLHSRQVAKDVQHLLVRYGIASRLSLTEDEFLLYIEDFQSLKKFNREIGMLGKNLKLVAGGLLSSLNSKKNIDTEDSILWDKIVDIESLGEEETYDLSVPGTFNFIADDIFVHNTFTMAVYILWYAYTHPDSYVLVACPYLEHVKKIFAEMRKFIKNSPELSRSKVKDVQNPQELEFGNGTRIVGFTSGARSGSKGDSARGQSPNLLVLDEVDRMTDEDLDSIMATRFANPFGVKMIMASTPTGRRHKFFNWCVTAQGGHIKVKPGRYRNSGWTTYYYPSTINPTWQIINPETGLTAEEELRQSGELSQQGWVHEVEAEFGEETVGVFRKQDIMDSMEPYKYYEPTQVPQYDAPRIIGVDWDKYQDSGTNIVVTEYDEILSKFKIIYREEIPRGEWTFDNAVNKIIELNGVYDPEWIYIDRGAGDYQYETLRKHGKENPETGLMEKVVAIHFSENREVIDPVTRMMNKKDAKSFMVDQTSILLERGKIILNELDTDIVRQMNNYSVVKITESGKPSYTSVDEHILDAFMLSILAFAEKMPELTQTLYTYTPASRVVGIPLARKQSIYRTVVQGAPKSVEEDRYELYDWKLKENKKLVAHSLSGRFSRRPAGRSFGPVSRRVF